MTIVIAVDGPAASGKGTLARRLAIHYGLPYLDTGTLYRGVARDMLAANEDVENPNIAETYARMLDPRTLESEQLRDNVVGAAASMVAKHEPVRRALLDYQRKFASQERGAVIDGRDIGTVICPNADVKLFVTASLAERSRRRFLELKIRGQNVTEDQIRDDIAARDQQDSKRKTAPLQQAEDAYLLDTTRLDIETVFNTALKHIENKLKYKPKRHKE